MSNTNTKVLLNFHIAGTEIPVGLLLITLIEIAHFALDEVKREIAEGKENEVLERLYDHLKDIPWAIAVTLKMGP